MHWNIFSENNEPHNNAPVDNRPPGAKIAMSTQRSEELIYSVGNILSPEVSCVALCIVDEARKLLPSIDHTDLQMRITLESVMGDYLPSLIQVYANAVRADAVAEAEEQVIKQLTALLTSVHSINNSIALNNKTALESQLMFLDTKLGGGYFE